MSALSYKIPFKGLLLILFELGFGININLIGNISASEIFVFFYTLIFLLNDPMLRDRSFYHIVLLYAGILFSQIISESVVSTSLNDSLKGISITVISFCHLYFLIKILKRSKKLLLWAYIGMVLKPILMGTTYSGDALMAIHGQDNVYMKFVIAPLVINALMIYSYFYDNRKTSILLTATGILFMLMGARSLGSLAFIAGVVSYFIISGHLTNYKHVLTYGLVSLLIIYGAYALYVTNVLTGRITTGNSGQIYRTENPYNPINLLRVGRTEAFIGAIAFSDKPLWGHGAWKKDSDYGYKYTNMKSQYQNLDRSAYMDELDIIPCHSIIIGFGCYNGIFTFIFGTLLFIWFLKMGLVNMFESKRYVILLTYFLIILLWHSLFSPQSHFRLTLPMFMSFIYVNYYSYMKKKKRISVTSQETEDKYVLVNEYKKRHRL